MAKLIYFLLIPILLSCKNESNENEIRNENETKVNTLAEEIETTNDIQDTLNIKYLEHKNLLDILKILPDSTMKSWSWKKNERVEFVNFIEKNNFTNTKTNNFFKFSLMGHNSIKIQVVDGLWTLSIYKIKNNNYIVITDDIVGDGNELLGFEYENEQLKYIKFENLFIDYYLNLLKNKNQADCKELLDDNKIGFEYDFTSTKNVIISNPYLNESENCFKGNSLNYQFNPTNKKFDLKSISWKKTND